MSEDWIVLGVAVAGFFYVSGIVLAVDAVMTVRTSQGSIAWIVSLLTFPYVAVPLYWVFGRRKYQGYIGARRTESRDMQPIIDRTVPELPEFVVHLEDSHMSFRVMEELAAMPFTRYNDAELLIDGEQTFAAIFEGIESAREYVLVQYFIIKDDQLGREFQATLMRKAKAGVRVYLLYDEIGCIRLPGCYLRELKNAGVEVSSFNTTKGLRNRFQLNFRNHRKVVIVDGRAAYIGGSNIGDEYMGRSSAFGPWRDTHICVRGPAVKAVQFAFIEDWYWATHRVPTLNWSPQRSGGGDEKFGARVKEMFEQDFARSRIVEQGELDALPVWFRFGVGIARLLAPIQ